MKQDKNCFYEKGLKFECQGCRHCCKDEPGYVFLSKADLDKMSSALSLSNEQFINTYCRKIDMGLFYMISLLEKKNYDCIFLSDKGCKIYDARPVQCSTYPFWEDIVESRENWETESKQCPGMNQGKLFTKKEIREKVLKRVSNEPLVIFK